MHNFSLLLVEKIKDVRSKLKGTFGRAQGPLSKLLVTKSYRFIKFALLPDVNAYDMLDQFGEEQRSFKLVLEKVTDKAIPDSQWICQVIHVHLTGGFKCRYIYI